MYHKLGKYFISTHHLATDITKEREGQTNSSQPEVVAISIGMYHIHSALNLQNKSHRDSGGVYFSMCHSSTRTGDSQAVLPPQKVKAGRSQW